MQKKYMIFGALFLASILINISLLRELLSFSLEKNFSTHIPLIPFISLFLIYRERAEIFAKKSDYWLFGIVILLTGAVVAGPWISSNLSIRALGIVLLWIGIFLFVFGTNCFRKAKFPLLFLAFMIPIPQLMLDHIIAGLQKGSAETTGIFFKLTGTIFNREGTEFLLPVIGIIDIAPECSSIRSSLALLITCLLASHLLLESNWRKLLFVAVAVPMSLVKNGIRIGVLSLLAIHVDKGWLTDSNLHHEGGILFFILALLLMFPLLVLLRRSEQKSRAKIANHPDDSK